MQPRKDDTEDTMIDLKVSCFGLKNNTASENEILEIRSKQQRRNAPACGRKASMDRNATPGIELIPVEARRA